VINLKQLNFTKILLDVVFKYIGSITTSVDTTMIDSRYKFIDNLKSGILPKISTNFMLNENETCIYADYNIAAYDQTSHNPYKLT
jgi:hypothetical protein